MNSVPTPTSLEGLKRQAKRLAKERNVTHSVALDRVAIAMGHANYQAARRALEKASS